MSEQVFDYEFQVWPDETRGFCCEVFDLFKMLGTRVVFEFTEAEYCKFKVRLGKDGFTLREVTRTPHYEPEAVK